MNELHLFAGAGGGVLGGILCGHTTVCAVEIEPYCRKVLLQRQRDGILPRFPIWDDVQTFDGKPWRGHVDIVCGGFPCQDISAAGKGAGIEGSRSSMWKHMARIIGEIRPQYAFVENSPLLVGRGLATVLADLAEMGYDAKWCVLGAVDAGAPHRRDRIWILATDSALSRCEKNEHFRNESKVTMPCGYGIVSDTNLCGCDNGSDTKRQHEVNHAQVRQTAQDQQSRGIGEYRACENGCDVADSAGSQDDGIRRDCECGRNAMEWNQQTTQQNHRAPDNHSPCRCSEDVANTNLPQCQGARQSIGIDQKYADTLPFSAWWRRDPAEAIESNVGRMANGVAFRVDRLKAIGNGQVPAVAALAWKTLINGIDH